MRAQKSVHDALQEGDVLVLQNRIAVLEDDLAATREEVEKHRAAESMKTEAGPMQKNERGRVMVQLREVQKERDHLKAMLGRLQADLSRTSDDATKALVAEKDAEMRRISQALSQARCDVSLMAQELKHSKVRPKFSSRYACWQYLWYASFGHGKVHRGFLAWKSTLDGVGRTDGVHNAVCPSGKCSQV